MNSSEEPRPRPSDEPEPRPDAAPRVASESPSLAEELPPGGEEGRAESAGASEAVPGDVVREDPVPGDAVPSDAVPEGTDESQALDAESPERAPEDAQSDEKRPEGEDVADAIEPGPAPTFVFFGVVAAVSLVLDVATKAWAEMTMNARGFVPIELIPGHLNVILAYNRGGAWGLLQDASEAVRKPFFLVVSVAAILFIVSLYGKLHHSQKALKWGLPLVLGGALGNLSDRITRSQVIDFIDYQGQWVLALNTFVRRYVDGWTVTDHWPTFNVADIAICVGVGLMAVDMFTSRRLRRALEEQERRAIEEQERQGQGGAPAESRSL